MQPTRERLQALKLNPVCHRVQLTELVREELAELAPLAMEKGEELVLEDNEDCWVETEPIALAIALQHLVINALNFSPPGSEVKVVIGTHCLSVQDQGRALKKPK